MKDKPDQDDGPRDWVCDIQYKDADNPWEDWQDAVAQVCRESEQAVLDAAFKYLREMDEAHRNPPKEPPWVEWTPQHEH